VAVGIDQMVVPDGKENGFVRNGKFNPKKLSVG